MLGSTVWLLMSVRSTTCAGCCCFYLVPWFPRRKEMKPMYASHTPKKKVCITYVACACVRADGAVRSEIERPHPSQRSRVCLDLRHAGRVQTANKVQQPRCKPIQPEREERHGVGIAWRKHSTLITSQFQGSDRGHHQSSGQGQRSPHK